MFSPFRRKSKNQKEPTDQLQLALDIGTSHIKAVIFEKVEDHIEIKGYSKVKQQTNAMRGAMIVNMKKVISGCDLAIGEALAMADKIISEEKDDPNYEAPAPQNVVLGIAGELVKGVAIMVNYEREEPDDKITMEEINDVVESVREQAFEGVVDEIAEEIGVSPTKIIEINSTINSTYIDGIKIDNPEGFTGSEVSYRVFTTFAPSIHLNSLKQIADELDLDITSIEVEPYVVARALNGSKEESFDGIIIDIGGGTTDVALVNHGEVIGTKMFAFGGDVFTRRVEKEFDIEFPEAEELKMKYSKLNVNETEKQKISNAFAKDIQIWLEGVEVSLSEFEDVKNYPNNIYICGGGSELVDIKEGLIKHPWLQVLPFLKYPRTQHIYPNQLSSIVDKTKKLIEPSDVAPAALALSFLEL